MQNLRLRRENRRAERVEPDDLRRKVEGRSHVDAGIEKRGESPCEPGGIDLSEELAKDWNAEGNPVH